MRIRAVYLLLPLCVCLLASGVSARKLIKRSRYDCSKEVQEAIELYNRGRFAKVKELLDEVRYQCSGHQVIDTVIYYLGMSHLQDNRAIEAQTEFERLIQNFPKSPFAEEARYRIGHSLYLQSNPFNRDQTETREAIRKLSDFLYYFPESSFADSCTIFIEQLEDKLARKEYETARFYHRIDEYEAAVVYYRSVIEEFSESDYVPRATVSLAEALIELNRYEEGLAVLEHIDKSDYGSEIRRKAKQLYQRVPE